MVQAFLTYGIPATGSTTARNVPDRLCFNVKNVKDWGATGDGVTDDWAAIQAAVDAVWDSTEAKRGTIYFPPGTYYVSAPIACNPGSVAAITDMLFCGDGAASKITGEFNGGIIQRYYTPGADTSVSGCPLVIENLWLNQDGEDDDDALTVPGSHCLYADGVGCIIARNLRCTTKKHGIGFDNIQGGAVFNCHVVCTGSVPYRFGIHFAGNGTCTSCYVSGFTTAIRMSQIGGVVSNCVIKNNDIGYEGGPYGIDPGAVNQFLTPFLILSNRFEDNDTGIYPVGAGAGLVAGNSVTATSASYGIRSSVEQPYRTMFAGNTCSGSFSVAAITTPSRSGRDGQFYFGMTATNSGAGDDWGEEQSNKLWDNVYVNSNSTGPVIRRVYSGLPTGSDGNRALGVSFWITDGNNSTWGGNVTGGFGGQHVKVRWNGTAWTVVGK